jgi:uncharacterized membrane protein YbhN (UPF0104 family)
VVSSLSFEAANLLCVALVAADFAARAWRIRWLVNGLGHRMSWWEAFELNAYGDVASVLTPLRVGGEPARLAGMLRARVPLPAGLVAMSVEFLAEWPVILLFAGWLGVTYAPGWFREVTPYLGHFLEEAWPWIALVGTGTILTAVWARRRVHAGDRALRRPVRRVLVYWRRLPLWSLAAGLPLTLVSLVARTGLLPILALGLPGHPPLGTLLVGSFALLYSQLILPTPAGAGVVELGFLAGVAGVQGPGLGVLLLGWRFYSVGVGGLIGGWLVLRTFEWSTVRRWLLARPVPSREPDVARAPGEVRSPPS